MADAYMDNEEFYRANTSGVMLRESEAPYEIVSNSQLTNGEKMDINEAIALLETIPVELLKRSHDTERKDDVQIQAQRTIRRMQEVTGTSYAPLWTLPSRSWEQRRTEMEAPGQEIGFMAFLQAATCADPGVFKGRENEIHREFVRRFRRNYRPVIKDDNALIDIFGDDHLGGRARSIFLAMPEYIKGQGFEAVVRELGNLVAGDSTAARMRALMELRNVRKRPGQSIVDFRVALEKLAKKSQPCRKR
ncbi:hypothetical protein ANCDUO_06175 [Ancylostoma duodenale]|uniref:Uncharacterized protein n=1 Tax=Ancylostoma duodenale TaxID=51022 RepID=A0A0C2D2D8_9BILA|nr:hypothetical protein ANCDUO_06175 [Ancylostoma duodenale]